MKTTKQQLKKIIKEELKHVLKINRRGLSEGFSRDLLNQVPDIIDMAHEIWIEGGDDLERTSETTRFAQKKMDDILSFARNKNDAEAGSGHTWLLELFLGGELPLLIAYWLCKEFEHLGSTRCLDKHPALPD